MEFWLSEFGAQKAANFGSGVLFIEMQLRQALAATAAANGQPDAFRTACVCECLSRLPEVAGGFSTVLGLLRQELLRAVYVDYSELSRLGRAIDAQQLLGRPTFFSQCDDLRGQVAALHERLADWQRAKEELAQDADGRKELLKLALARWNGVLANVRAEGGAPETLHETSRKLSALLDTMSQHSAAINELERLSLLEPGVRLAAHLTALGESTRRRTLRGMLKQHGHSLLVGLTEEERLRLVRELLLGLNVRERQSLVLGAATDDALVGSSANLLHALIEAQMPNDADALLARQLRAAATKRPYASARRELRAQVDAALKAAHATLHTRATRDEATQAGDARSEAVHKETQTLPTRHDEPPPPQRTPHAAHAQQPASSSQPPARSSQPRPSHDERADVLATVAAEVGPEATAALHLALDLLDEEVAAIDSAVAAGSPPPDETYSLLPLVRALEATLAGQRQREAALREELAKLRLGQGGVGDGASDSSEPSFLRPEGGDADDFVSKW